MRHPTVRYAIKSILPNITSRDVQALAYRFMGKKFWFEHRWNAFATHQPVLFSALSLTSGPVLELGCGEGSTRMMHHLCLNQGRELISIDHNAHYLSFYERRFRSRTHVFESGADWASALSRFASWKWGVVFVDCGPGWHSRILPLQLFKDRATFIVIHDIDALVDSHLIGQSMSPINGTNDRGVRDYSETFKYWKEFFPLDPWPNHRTGPPTLLASNERSCEIEINYADF